MKLIKCSDYVISLEKQFNAYPSISEQMAKRLDKIEDYANFLKRPLELGMFIPTDKDGNVLKFDIPLNHSMSDVAQIEFSKQYQEAKDRVLFKGNWSAWGKSSVLNERGGKIVLKVKTIEDLCELGLELTESAIKQLKV